MKKYVSASPRATSVAGFMAATIAAAAFWLATSSAIHAQGTMCSVCHKRTQTIQLPCDSLDYRRHLDHGDPAHGCGVTGTDNP
ncbi:MAG TPA: hypothetical protein VGC85_00350 [Chthoniobacterales bacterium]